MAYGATGARLNQYAPGDAVWPTGASEERLAIVVGEEACPTMALSSAPGIIWRRTGQTRKLYRYYSPSAFWTGPSLHRIRQRRKTNDSRRQTRPGDAIVLDGAIGSEIDRIGGKMDEAAWCGLANLTDPDTVRRVHESYLEAGADVITANTFASCRHVLEAVGYGDQTVSNIRRAVELAREALDRVAPDRPVAVAGSMSNHVAWLPGTVGPDPAYEPSPQKQAANYREMADVLAEAGCDLLVMEMMTDIENASRTMEAAVATGLPVWTGISTSRRPDDKMVGWNIVWEEADGRVSEDYEQAATKPLETIIDALYALGPQAVGIMHSSMPSTTLGLEVLFDRWSGPVMAYPEATGFDAETRQNRRTVPPDEYAGYCRGWVDGGVQIIGGCCGTTVHHIRAMVDRLPARPGSRPGPTS
ncbi:MAG: homocysteine S-methyltransferase family protein [Gammaproteobacteria bacterium]|nr:homocysteine S-methyltransferase family protein [Gammaproteobacteria bacterium]